MLDFKQKPNLLIVMMYIQCSGPKTMSKVEFVRLNLRKLAATAAAAASGKSAKEVVATEVARGNMLKEAATAKMAKSGVTVVNLIVSIPLMIFLLIVHLLPTSPLSTLDQNTI